MNKPTEPKAPKRPVEPKPTIRQRSNAALEDCCLLNFLDAHFPMVPLSDIFVEDFGEDCYRDKIELATYKEVPNPKYSAQKLRYDSDLREFEENLEIYKGAMILFDQQMDNYTEIKRAEEKQKLLKRLKDLEK